MANPILTNIHVTFSDAVRNSTYIAFEGEKNKFKNSPTKDERLYEIFKNARILLETNFQVADNLNKLQNQIEILDTLHEDGKSLYKRYCDHTNTWFRKFARFINEYAPEFLKNRYPNLFFNNIKQAEKTTLYQYNEYKQKIKQLKDNLTTAKPELENKILEEARRQNQERTQRQQNPQQRQQNNQEDVAQGLNNQDKSTKFDKPEKTNAPGLKNQQKKRSGSGTKGKQENENNTGNGDKTFRFSDITNDLTEEEIIAILKSDQAAHKVPETSEYVTDFDAEEFNRALAASLESLQKTTESEVFHEKRMKGEVIEKYIQNMKAILAKLKELDAQETLCPYQFRKLFLTLIFDFAVLSSTVDRSVTVKYLKNNQFETALLDALSIEAITEILKNNSNETAKYKLIADMLAPTSLGKNFAKALATHRRAELVVENRAGVKVYRLKCNDNTVIGERNFNTFKGTVIVSADKLHNLAKLLDETPSFNPSVLEINTEGEILTDDLANELIDLFIKHPELSYFLPNIKFINLKEICLKSEVAEGKFLAIFDKIECPSLIEFVPKDLIKKPINIETLTKYYSKIINFCPSIGLLRHCYNELLDQGYKIADYNAIPLPNRLLLTYKLETEGWTIEQVKYLLTALPFIQVLQIDHANMREATLKEWLNSGILNNLRELNIQKLNHITTDIIHSLVQIPQLAKIKLPTLKQGTRPLDQLPKFDNPFKISLFYTQSKLTLPWAAKLYTGPTAWMPLFQIPMARSGENIHTFYREQDEILDSNSVCLWVYKADYEKLTPQNQIITILSDGNPFINDDNIVNFIKKFPNLIHLSLQLCPQLTSVGIQRIIDVLHETQIEIIDLTDCHNIDDSFLLNQKNLEKLKKIKSINLSGTRITKDVIDSLDLLKGKLIFKERTLKITNDQLKGKDFVINLLNTADLHEYVYLDLTGCCNLTNQDLRQILDRLNVDKELIDPLDKSRKGNPKRLNIVHLNLTGCSQITTEALLPNKQDKLVLGELEKITLNGTQIEISELMTFYPHIVINPTLRLKFFNELHPRTCLKSCERYHINEFNSRNGNEVTKSRETLKDAGELITNRIFLQLFPESYQEDDQELYSKIMSIPVQTTTDHNIYPVIIRFKTREDVEKPELLVTTRTVMEQFDYFRQLNPCWKSTFNWDTTLINQNATPETVLALSQLMYDKLDFDKLNWKVAANLAELISAENLAYFGSAYKKLIAVMVKNFELDVADEMLMRMKQLNNKQGLQELEFHLLGNLIINKSLVNRIGPLAQNYGLTNLIVACNKLTTAELEKRDMQENTANDTELARQLVENYDTD